MFSESIVTSELSLVSNSNSSVYFISLSTNDIQLTTAVIEETTSSFTGLWYNRPMFSPCALWYPNATTFANESTLGSQTHGVFIDTYNTIYASSWSPNVVKLWPNGSSTATRTIQGGFFYPMSFFVAMNGDIYIDNGYLNGQVNSWASNAAIGTRVMNISAPCFGLFIDTNNTLYCSLANFNNVFKVDLISVSGIPVMIAGNGSSGSTSSLLNYPWGIYVDTDFTLYVADCYNHRIQRFGFGELNGTTVAGGMVSGTISLNYPTSIVLDGNGYLFIMDTGYNRIVASSSAGFRCVAGCSATIGSTADTLNNACYMSFDTYGNMFLLTTARIVIRSGDQNWNIGGGSSGEVWNGWSHVKSKDNFWGCGNNFRKTLQKDDMICTYRASYYHPSFDIVILNGKSAGGSFSYDRTKSKEEVYNAFVEFIEKQIAAQTE
ncbi:unnamed protein product [Adineta steineri]|uniref:NHL repeat containing protein n=1 Tax=Adineta steineri TaxID=433720 RepID=A0A819SU09_9BILA|nr:unnamed protein product [Adineta steineri]CAF0862824.1 unnamed protein product [Adineta steineri]CAF4077135.1 unnamed protein product [Adineta steineri]